MLREALSKNEKTHARIKCSTPEEPDYTTKGGNPGAFVSPVSYHIKQELSDRWKISNPESILRILSTE